MGEYYYTGNLCFDPLTKQENIDALASLSKIVKTCIGPRGKLKLIRNGDHTTTVSSSSSRIFQSLSVKNHFNRIILSSAKSHLKTYGDGGLLTALFPLSLIEHSLLCDDVSPNLRARLYEYFMHEYIACLNSSENGCVWRLDLSNLQHLRSVTRTILSSKLECLLSSLQRDHVCALLLEMFLTAIPSSGLHSSNFRFITQEGLDTRESRLLNGLLLKVPKMDWVLFPPHLYKSVKVALLLSVEVCSQDALKVILSKKVEIFFCQKVVHPHLKKQLKDAGIIVLDQLGTQTATFLHCMLGDNSTEELCFSTIDECVRVEIGRKHYVLLQKKQIYCTLLICHHNQEFLSELKVVCEQAIAALFRLLHSPKVCFGAGCTDIFTALLFTQKIKEQSRDISTELGCCGDKILSALKHFVLGLTASAISPHQEDSSPLNFAIDSKYGHLWNLRHDPPTCCCGQCRASSIDHWHPLSDLMHVPAATSCEVPSFEAAIIDEFSSKVDAVTVGGEVALSLLKTHLCILTGCQNVC